MKFSIGLFGAFAVFVVVYVESVPLPENEHSESDNIIIEDDIILSPGQKNGGTNPNWRWPNNTVPYTIAEDYNDTQRAVFQKALSIFNKTCIIVRERKSTDKDYIYFTKEVSGCMSMVGYQGGMQKINLSKSCMIVPTVQHEFLHALGFNHMQNNPNRDQYITVHLENVELKDHKFFRIDKDVTDYGLPYDYSSVMHYTRTALSKNGKDTMVPKDPTAVIGEAKK